MSPSSESDSDTTEEYEFVHSSKRPRCEEEKR